MIESAVSRLAHDRKVVLASAEQSLVYASERIWSPIESDRVVNMAMFTPSLLNHEEGCIRSVLEGANHIFFTKYEVRSKADADYRSYAFERMGAFQQSEDGQTVFVTPKRKTIKLAWGLIKDRAAELADKGVCADLSTEEVEEYIGKPLSSVAPDIKVPGVVFQDDDGIGYLGAERESDDLIESLGIKR